MKKAVWSGVVAAAIVLGISATAYAQTDSTTVQVQANLTAKAKLTLTGGPVSFPDQDPDAAATLTATSPLTVDVKVRTSTGGLVTLIVQAGGDLVSATDAIPIGNLSWESADAGFADGTASSSSATSAGSWTGPGSRSGAQTFKLVNDWNYKSGNYSVTLTYTLTAA